MILLSDLTKKSLPSRHLTALLGFVLPLIVFLLYAHNFFQLASNAIDIPSWDEWSMMPDTHAPPLSFGWLFSPYKEHLVALTRVEIWLPRRVQYVVLGLMLPIFAYAVKGLPPRYELLAADFHRTQAMEMPKKIKLLSSEKDIIWMDLPVGGLYIPLYAQRWIAMDPLVKLADLNPTLIRLKKDWRPMSYLRSLPRVWIEGAKTNFYFYRVREVDGFPYDPHRHLAVSDEDSGPRVKWEGRWVLKIDSCRRGGNKPVSVEIRNPSGYISVYAQQVSHSFLLPAKKYVSLPPQSPWGCRFEIRRQAEF